MSTDPSIELAMWVTLSSVRNFPLSPFITLMAIQDPALTRKELSHLYIIHVSRTQTPKTNYFINIFIRINPCKVVLLNMRGMTLLGVEGSHIRYTLRVHNGSKITVIVY